MIDPDLLRASFTEYRALPLIEPQRGSVTIVVADRKHILWYF